WPLPSMAPLAHTLALLAMTVATTAIEEVPLDMAPNSFDDQYLNCSSAMTAALPALKRSELQNPVFAEIWAGTAEQWEGQQPPASPLLSQDQATAVSVYLMNDLYDDFIVAMREAGRSSQEYRDKFHLKALHFLLTDAMARLRDAQGQKCHCVVREAQRGDTVRFGQFVSSTLCNETTPDLGTGTVFQVETCHGVGIPESFYYFSKKEVLIPPF
ncbi:NARE ribosyltransferase, partial [Dryoscopus gambensis]|nr:NARE ribosyltransferase [Dryoscopus gambensis]